MPKPFTTGPKRLLSLNTHWKENFVRMNVATETGVAVVALVNDLCCVVLCMCVCLSVCVCVLVFSAERLSDEGNGR